MGKRSSRRFVWIGKEPSPFPGSIDMDSCSPGDCAAILVSGNQDPDSVIRTIRDYCCPEIPWLVYCSEKKIEQWLDTGTTGFIPVGTSDKFILATLQSISRLLKNASTRNPLSGLPGNLTIASMLVSDVLEGISYAAYFDISGFKPFNDYYGFSRGDAVLRALAGILTDNLNGYFVGHIGGDDFVAVGSGDDFVESVERAARIFNGRAGGFYSGRDHAAGGIETLDRSGEFRFYPVMDLTVSIVDGKGCSSVEELAQRAGLEKKRLKGELLPDTVASFLDGENGNPEYEDFKEWLVVSEPDTLQVKALIEGLSVLGDNRMTRCLIEILYRESDHKIRKSAARALGNIAGQDSSEALKAAMKDGNVHVRTAATMALPFVLGRQAGLLLKYAVNDGNTWVRRAALRGLGISGWGEAAGRNSWAIPLP